MARNVGAREDGRRVDLLSAEHAALEKGEEIFLITHFKLRKLDGTIHHQYVRYFFFASKRVGVMLCSLRPRSSECQVLVLFPLPFADLGNAKSLLYYRSLIVYTVCVCE